MWQAPPSMHGETMPPPNKLVAVAIDKDGGSQIALKWTVDHLLARRQTVLLIHVKLKQSTSSSGSNQVADEGSRIGDLNQQTKELFFPFRVFCTRKDVQCHDVVLENTDVAKAIVEYVNRTGVEVLIVGASTRGGLLRFKAKDIPGGVLKGVPDFCTVHVISKSGKISSTRAASRPAPFIHPLRHQLMQPASTKFAAFEPSTHSAANSKGYFSAGPKPVCVPPPYTLQSMHGERMPPPNKLVAIAIDKDRGSQIALKWTVDHLLARGQIALLIHVKLKQSTSSSVFLNLDYLIEYLLPDPTDTGSNQVADEGSGTGDLDPQTKELFLPFRVFCTRKDVQCHYVVLEDTDIAKAIVEYVNRTGVEVLIVGALTRGGLLRFKAKDIPGGMLKGVPDFCTVHVISKSGKISSTRAASRPAPFIHPLRHQLMQLTRPKCIGINARAKSNYNII